jgi:hypothetical protein
MIIHANSEEGKKTKVYNADGTEVTLAIKSYNTVTQTASHYELDENNKIKMTDYRKDGNLMKREPVITETKIEGSYATIDGVRV